MKLMGVKARGTRRWIKTIALLAGVAFAGLAQAELPPRLQLADLKALEEAFVDLARKVRPSVVAIRTYSVREPKIPGAKYVMRPFSQGSGFVIDAQG